MIVLNYVHIAIKKKKISEEKLLFILSIVFLNHHLLTNLKFLKMSFSKTVSNLRETFFSGKTRDLEWRIAQLKSLLRFYEENSDLFVEAIQKDLR